jgi:hypothetical protein
MRKPTKLFNVATNDADYKVVLTEELPRVNGKRQQKTVWICPYYSKWRCMLKRVYCPRHQKDFPSYQEVSVCEEWLTFSNFKVWMENQDWQGKELDKDLLSPESKEYSPSSCCFISKQINLFMTSATGIRGEYPIGVHFDNFTGKFKAQCRNPFKNRQDNLGLFDSAECAHFAWKTRKLLFARELAKTLEPRLGAALVARYSFE